MRYAALAVLCALASGCNSCGDPPAEAPAEEAPAAAAGGQVLDSGQLGAIYRQAYDRARKEITSDNAWQRLEDLERQVESEREMEK